MDDFLWRAVAGGFGVAVIAGPLGAFVVWRRMAYFGDTLAHAALLGVALGFLLGIDINLGIVAVCAAVAVILVALQRRQPLAGDTLLGILSHGGLALGLIAVAFLESPRIDLMSYLFGDILAVSARDIAWVYGGGAVVAAALAFLWRPLLAATVHEELARVEGVPVTAVRLAFMVLLAIVVALAMKVVGVLLVTSLLIIPAAAARRLAGSPEQMAALAAVAGCGAVAGGLWGSFTFDTPSGPSIVVAALVLFVVSALVPAVRPGRHHG
ncbi:MAG: metal ABC transporter permease [Rhodospirillales bacterium]